MNGKRTIFALLIGLSMHVSAEMRLFQNPEKTKTFMGELTAYDAKNKLVSVRMKNGRVSKFSMDHLSKEDQEYVEANAKRLAIANDLRVSLDEFHKPSRKVKKGRVLDRIQASGYNIMLSNRSKVAMLDISMNYTLYYKVQGYLKPKRTTKSQSGTLNCEVVAAIGSISYKTETVDIVSGKLEPKIDQVQRRNADGEKYTETVVREPGGRRKDLLVGCRVDILVNDQVVKTVTDGITSLEK